jgi:AcrR family transcriptional regulator
VEQNGNVRDRILDAVSDIVVNDGLAAVSVRSIAHRGVIDEQQIENIYLSREHLLMELLNREYTWICRIIADNVERDPAGGLLSRIYHYALGAMYERPLARALYLEDPDSLNQILRASHGTDFFPRVDADRVFLETLKKVGMIRADVDVTDLAAFLSAYMAGVALTAPDSNIDATTAGLVALLERGVDAGVADTTPGKVALYELLERRDGD